MGKGKKSRNVVTKKSGALKRAQNRVKMMIIGIVFLGDTMQEARKRLEKTNRLQINTPKWILLQAQLSNCTNVLEVCGILPNEVEFVRKDRDEPEFEKEVERLMNAICPIVILTGK